MFRMVRLSLIFPKGFDEGTYLRLSETIREEIPNARVFVMSGPSHAEEVGRGMPTTNVIANEDHDLAVYVQKIFMTDKFRIYTNTDVIGVELGGRLKCHCPLRGHMRRFRLRRQHKKPPL